MWPKDHVCIIMGCKGKGKTPCRQEWSRAIAPLILSLGCRWEWVVNSTLRPLYPRERGSVPVVQAAGWTPRAGLGGFGTPDCSARSCSSRHVTHCSKPWMFYVQLHALFMFIGTCVLQTDWIVTKDGLSCPVRQVLQNSTTLMAMGQKVDCVTVTVTRCSFEWTHRLRLHGIRVLVLCSLCLNDFLTVMFCCPGERRGRNRSCTTSSRLDARGKFTVYCCLLQWSVPIQTDQPRSQTLQRIRNQFDGFVSCWLC